MDRSSAYAELGLRFGASREEVKAAYRRRAKEVHPDLVGGALGAEVRFEKVKAARDVLLREAPRDDPSEGRTEPPHVTTRGSVHEWRRGEDRVVEVEVPLEIFLRGGKVVVRGSAASCSACGGRGHRSTSGPVSCATCGGSGRGTISKGIIRVRIDCPECAGSGKVNQVTCTECGGGGAPGGASDVEVSLAQGAAVGGVVTMPSRGHPGNGGGPQGDMVVTLRAAPHRRFRHVGGGDLAATLSVSFADLCLGGEAQIEPLGGGAPLKVRMPPGTPAGTITTFSGEGIYRVAKSGRGKLSVRLMPRVPSIMTSEQTELLRRWKALDKV